MNGITPKIDKTELVSEYVYRYGELICKNRLNLIASEWEGRYRYVVLVFNKWLVLDSLTNQMDGIRIYTYAVYQNILHVKSHRVLQFNPPSNIFHSLPTGAPVYIAPTDNSKTPFCLIGFIGRTDPKMPNIYPILGPDTDSNILMIPLTDGQSSRVTLSIREILIPSSPTKPEGTGGNGGSIIGSKGLKHIPVSYTHLTLPTIYSV